jgi:hypothetical protein
LESCRKAIVSECARDRPNGHGCWELSSRTLLAEAEKARRWTAPTRVDA